MSKSLIVTKKGIESDASVKSTKPVEFTPRLIIGPAYSGHDETEISMISLRSTKTAVASGMQRLNPSETELFSLIKMGIQSALKCMFPRFMALPGFFISTLLKLCTKPDSFTSYWAILKVDCLSNHLGKVLILEMKKLKPKQCFEVQYQRSHNQLLR